MLGVHLYASEWTGYEIYGEVYEDLNPIVEKKKDLCSKLEILYGEINEFEKLKMEIGTIAEKQQNNEEIRRLRKSTSAIHAEINSFKVSSDSQIADHGVWERYKKTFAVLLNGLSIGVINVKSRSGCVMRKENWSDLPKDFGFDLENSIVFWPERQRNGRMSSALINNEEFDKWLKTIEPIVKSADYTSPIEWLLEDWFKNEVKKYDGSLKKDTYLHMIGEKYKELCGDSLKKPMSKREGIRLWDNNATMQIKSPGPKAQK